jgi:hypothetical protein
VDAWVADEVAILKAKGWTAFWSLNMEAGGDGSSGEGAVVDPDVPGSPFAYFIDEAEVVKYGLAMAKVDKQYNCGLGLWIGAHGPDGAPNFVTPAYMAAYTTVYNALVKADAADPGTTTGGTPPSGSTGGGGTVATTDPTGTQASMADALVETMSVQLHLNYTGSIYQTGWTDIVRPALLDLGIRYVRERMGTDPTIVDRFKDLAANGIRMTAGCWPEGTNYTDASHIITRANAHGTAVVSAFDGWNEVDGQSTSGSWSAAWVAWQTAYYAAIKANSTWQNRVVLGNSLAASASCDSVGDRHTILDAGNMHSYPTSSGMPSGVSSSWIPQWKKIAGTKPLWTTETGYHNALAAPTPGISQLAVAKYYSRIFFEYFNRGVVRTNLYELVDQGVSNTDREKSWGLIANSGTHKQQYAPVKNVIGLLADPGASFTPGKLNYTLTGASTSTHTTLLQKRNGRFYLVIWNEIKVVSSSYADITNSPVAVTLTLGTAASAINVYRPRTGTGTIQTGSGTSIALSVPDEALIVEIIR